jgi:sortase A
MLPTGAESRPSGSFLPATSAPSRSFGSLLAVSMRRNGGRRSMSALIAVLLLGGAGLFGYPAYTDFLHAHARHITNRFADPSFRTLYKEHQLPIGAGITRLIIDNNRVHVNVMVVQGTTLAALQAGAGHYVPTPLPCERGNVGIAGHRTTYGRPFNKLNYMKAGDIVRLVTPFQECDYRVVPPFDGHSNSWTVQPNDYSVVSQKGVLGTGHWLTLTSCNPLGSDAQRIILRLTLVRVRPLTASQAKAASL